MAKKIFPLILVIVAAALAAQLMRETPGPPVSYLTDAEVYVGDQNATGLPLGISGDKAMKADRAWQLLSDSPTEFPSHTNLKIVVGKFADHRGMIFAEPVLSREGNSITIDIPFTRSKEPIPAVYLPSAFSREFPMEALPPGEYKVSLHDTLVGSLLVQGKAGRRHTAEDPVTGPIERWTLNTKDATVCLAPDGEVEMSWHKKSYTLTLPESLQEKLLPTVERANAAVENSTKISGDVSSYLTYQRNGNFFRCTPEVADSKTIAYLTRHLKSLIPDRVGYGPDKIWVRGVVRSTSSELDKGWEVVFGHESVEFDVEIAEQLLGKDVILFGEFVPEGGIHGRGFYDCHDILEF